MNPFKKLASQTAIYGLPTIVGRLLNYFLVPLYTYNFETDEYGIVNEMYAYVSFLLIVLTYGMETALFNFSRKQETIEGKQKVYSVILTSVLLTSGIFIAILSVLSQPIANVIRHEDHPEYITWFALIVGFDAVSSIAFAKLREQNKAAQFAMIKTLNIFVNIFFNILFLWVGKGAYEKALAAGLSTAGSWYDPQIGIGYIFISNLLASAVTLLVQVPAILKARFSFDLSQLKAILPYALPLMVAGLAGMTNETVDRILLKYLLPEDISLAQVGIYGACYKISIIMTIFIQTFRYAAEPFFFSHAQDKNSGNTYAMVMNYFTIACMIIFLGTMLNLNWIQYFVGEPFREGLHVVPILLMANFCLGVLFNLSIWYKLADKTRLGAYLTVFGAVITLVGNYIFIPKYGYLASAWTTLVCYAAMMVVSYVLGNKHFPVNYHLKRFFGYVALSLILYALSGYIAVGSVAADLVLKNLLLIAFMTIVFVVERKNLPGLSNESQNNK